MQALKQCQLIILCGTTKPYEIGSVKAAIKELEGLPMNIMLSHTPKSAQKDVEDVLKRENSRVYFAEHSPELFDGKASEKIFLEIVKEYMQVEPNE